MNQYIPISKLGEGAFSVVYRVKRKEDQKEYAMKKIKIMNLNEKQVANCLNEVRILASIDDPHILAYKDSFFDELTSTFCIITECLQGGDVFNLISTHKMNKKLISQSLIWQVAYQSLKGLATLHDLNVLHRDIKGANIFFTKDQSQIKLADMNVSIVTANGMAKTQTGTPYYASPQVWQEKPYSSKCDIWSMGCVLYQMAAQRPPFVSADLKSLKRAIIGGVYKRIPIQYSMELQNFIRLCLKLDPKDRPSAVQLLQNQSLKKRVGLKIQLNQSINLNGSLKGSMKLLERIQPLRKRDFRNIKQFLPKHRFNGQQSLGKIQQNSSYFEDKMNQNLNPCPNTGKIIKKDQLPTIQRSTSLNRPSKLKQIEDKMIQYENKPPLPKKPLRA